MSEAFWIRLQADHDLEEAQKRPGERLETEVSVHAAWDCTERLKILCLKMGLSTLSGIYLK